MITRYVLHLTCSKNDPEGKPRRLLLTFLSAGGNNVPAGLNGWTHKLVVAREGEYCPEVPPADAHAFIVTPTSYNEWVKKAEERLDRSEWNRKVN